MRSPDLLRLTRYFVAVAAEAHFGHAADRLEITQPSLSQGLQRLERLLGVTLIHRGPRSVELTAAGAALLPAARRLLAAEGELLDQAGEHAATATTLRLGVAAPVPAHLVAALATACQAASPHGGVSVRTAPTSVMIAAVAAGRLDYAVTVHPAVLGDLAAGEIVHLPTDLLVPSALAPEPDARTRLRDLVVRPLAVAPREHAPAAHDLLTDTLLAHGVAAATTAAEDERSALALVAAGLACALSAEPHLRAPGIARRTVPDDVLALRVRVIWKPSPQRRQDDLGQRLSAALTSAPAPGASTAGPSEEAGR